MRTYAMSLAAAGVGIIAVALGSFTVAFILPAIARDPQRDSAVSVTIIAGFITVFAVLAMASFVWHMALLAHSTTAVAIKPTAAGTLQFYCAVPGHREAGMAGALTITE